MHSESSKLYCKGGVKVEGLRRCGNCMRRVANRIVMVVSRWLWVVVTESRDFNRKVTKNRDFKTKAKPKKVETSMGKRLKSFNRKVLLESRDFNRRVTKK